MVPAENKAKRLSSVNHTTKIPQPYHNSSSSSSSSSKERSGEDHVNQKSYVVRLSMKV